MIKPTPTQLFEQPVNCSKYKRYNVLQLPKIILGFAIRNQYDEQRLRIKSVMRPKNISHVCGDDDQHIMRFHAIELNGNTRVNHLCSTIHRASPITPESYRNILKYNRLSCDTNTQLLRDGVYPIDVKCLPLLSRNKFRTDYIWLRSLLETNEDLPWFSSWSNFNIFMLCSGIMTQNQHK